VWALLKRTARAVLTCHVPVSTPIRPLFRQLYNLHVLGREALAFALRFCWFEPLFRSQCVSVGDLFQMEQLPYIAGRGRIVIGNSVRLSGKSSFGFNPRFGLDPSIVIGSGTFIGHACGFSVAASITIGERCLIAGGVSVRDFDGHPIDFQRRRENQLPSATEVRPVSIGNDVWIGAGAMILKGVTIGDRAIVGAGAVVTRNVPADCIVAGNPARVVRQLNSGTHDGRRVA
jgi:acetyltransferase-like isoleucine patch superfamily enzyme